MRFRDEGPCPVCGDMCKRRSLPGGPGLVYVGDGVSDHCAALASERIFARSWPPPSSSARGPSYEPFETLDDVAAALPDPYDFVLSTERFRVFGADLANLWVDGALHRAVGGREVRIAAASGGVDVEPLDDLSRPVVERPRLPFDPRRLHDLGLVAAGARRDRPAPRRVPTAARPIRSRARRLDHGAAGFAQRGLRDSQPIRPAVRHVRRGRLCVSDEREGRGCNRGRALRTRLSRERRPTPSACALRRRPRRPRSASRRRGPRPPHRRPRDQGRRRNGSSHATCSAGGVAGR